MNGAKRSTEVTTVWPVRAVEERCLVALKVYRRGLSGASSEDAGMSSDNAGEIPHTVSLRVLQQGNSAAG